MAKDAQSLLDQAKCYQCYASNGYAAGLMELSLLSQWAGGSPTPPAAFTIYTTPLIAPGSGALTFQHGLGQVPPIVMPVLVCTSNDASSGMVAGNEIPLKFVSGSVISAAPISFSTVDATTLYVSTGGFSVGMEGSSSIGSSLVGDFNNFRLKVYVAVPAGSIATFSTNATVALSTVAHGLGATPTMIVPVIQCVSNDANTHYVAGDELPSNNFSINTIPTVLTGMNATSIFSSAVALFAGNEAACNFPVKGVDGFAANPSSNLNFLLKIRAWSLTGGFQTPPVSAGAGKVSFNHGLGKTPQIVIPVIACQVNDAPTSYLVGDEMMPENWTQDGGASAGSGELTPASVFYSSATQITIDRYVFSNAFSAFLDTITRSGGRLGPVNPSNFGLKLYAYAL